MEHTQEKLEVVKLTTILNFREMGGGCVSRTETKSTLKTVIKSYQKLSEQDLVCRDLPVVGTEM